MPTILPGLNTGAPDATASDARGPFNQTLAPESAGLGTPSLHPVAQPENYFVQPPQYAAAQEQATRNVQQIAGALQSFQPALAQFAQERQTLQQVQAENAGKAIPAGATPDQVHQIVAQTPALQTIAGQRVASGYAGNNAGQTLAQQLDQALHDPTQFNPLKDDPNAFAQKFIAGATANMDQFGKAGLNQAIEPVLARYRNEQSQTIASNKQETLTNSVTNFASSTFERILADNSIPADKKASTFWATWNQQAKTNNTLFGMKFGEQQNLLAEMLKEAGPKTWTDPNYASRAQMISDVANYDRGNGFGTLAASIAGGATSNAAVMANSVADRRAAMTDTQGLAHLHQLAINGDPNFPQALKDYAATPEGARAARGAGTMQNLLFMWQNVTSGQKLGLSIQANNRLADENLGQAKIAAQQSVLAGDSNSIKPYTDQRWSMKDGIPQQATTNKSAEEMKVGAVTDLQANIDTAVKAGHMSPEQAQANENHIWMDSGTENPTWKTNLQAGFASTSTMTAGGRPSANTLQAFQLYQRLQSYSDTYAGSIMSPKAETFYRLAQSAKDIGYNDDASALSAAYKAVTSGRDALKMPVTAALPNPMAVDQKIRGYLPRGWFGGGLAGAAGATTIVNRIRDDAAMLANGNGLDPADAIAAVAPKVIGQYANVNGSAINIGSAMVPPNFPQLAQKVIDNYWDVHGKELEAEGMSKSDLTVRQLNGTPNWGMVFKKSGFQPPGNTSFSVSDLGPVQQQLHAESRAAAEKAAAADKAAAAVRSSIPIPGVQDAVRPILAPIGGAIRRNASTLSPADLTGP